MTEHITVTVIDAGHAVRVFVQDDDPTPPVLVEPNPTDVGGHGMHLIDQLATDWGVNRVKGDGKRLWFDLERGAPSSHWRVSR